MTRELVVALAQLRSTGDPQHNLGLVGERVAQAAARGAALVVFPEATMVRFGADASRVAEPLDGAWAQAVRGLAREHGVVVAVGMFTPAEDGRVHNTVLVTDGEGVDVHYDKVHLYDAFTTRESDTTAPGTDHVTVDLLGTRAGVATCYDVRFADQFTAMGRDGAEVVLLPTAWADGERKADQWELLVRARAMDAQAFVVGVDQAFDPDAKLSFGVGRSLVAGPLGEVLSQCGDDEELRLVSLDLERVHQVRAEVPVLFPAG